MSTCSHSRYSDSVSSIGLDKIKFYIGVGDNRQHRGLQSLLCMTPLSNNHLPAILIELTRISVIIDLLHEKASVRKERMLD